ncbi:MAG: pilin [Candidatus Peregrinibacteria bacterium]|nr:pilin [Candidatus Peregrinibacteria bacterium]
MKNFKSTIRTLFISTILATFFATSFAYAGINDKTTPPNPKNDLTEGTFNVKENLKLDSGEQPKKYFADSTQSPIVSLIITVIDFAITIMGSIAVILFIVAGFMFMASQGNSQKLDEAKDIIKYAAIGLIVALLSYVITIFVQSIFSNG